MSKAKSIFITAVMAVMLSVILVGAYMIEPKIHTGISLALMLYGFFRGSFDLCAWLQKEPAAEPKHLETVQGEDPFAYDDEREDDVKLFEADRIRFENVKGA